MFAKSHLFPKYICVCVYVYTHTHIYTGAVLAAEMNSVTDREQIDCALQQLLS